MTPAPQSPGRAAPAGERLVAEGRLAELRAKLRQALAEKKARLREFVESCKADRRAVREKVREMRARSLRDLTDQVQVARGAAKLTRLTRLAEVRQVTSAAVDRARAMAAVERQHQAELARIARDERSRRAEIRLAHERALVASDVRLTMFGKLAPLFERDARAVRPAPGESRAEALLRFAERNPEKAHAALEPHVHRKVEETQRAVTAAERAVRLAGGNPRAARALVGAAPRKAHVAPSNVRPVGASVAAAHPEKAETLIHEPRHAPSGHLAPPTAAASEAASKLALSGRQKKLSELPSESKRESRDEERPSPRGARSERKREKAPPKRRKGQIPPGGMLLEDFLRENAEVASKKAARRAKRTATRAKKTSAPAAPSPPLPLSALPANPNAANASAAPSRKRVPAVASKLTESVKPFKVRASCGHILIRPMREATAGQRYSPDVVIDAPKGRACDACEAKKDFAAHAPKPGPKKDAKAPELKDTAEIAKRIRADIRDAVRKKELPKGKYSVRTSKYSMGSSIDVAAAGLPFPVLNPAAFHLEKGSSHIAFDRDRFKTRYTHEAESVLSKLSAIVDAYHWDRSDPSTDYHHARFGRDVKLDDDAEWRKLNAERVAAARGGESRVGQS